MLYEQVVGPLSGYFVALCATDVTELGSAYRGFYKIFPRAVRSYFDAGALLRGASPSSSPGPACALACAQATASEIISNMPHRAELAAAGEERALFWFEEDVYECPVRRRAPQPPISAAS
jgi:hypothetical protein